MQYSCCDFVLNTTVTLDDNIWLTISNMVKKKYLLILFLQIPTYQMKEADDVIPLLPVKEKITEKLFVNTQTI